MPNLPRADRAFIEALLAFANLPAEAAPDEPDKLVAILPEKAAQAFKLLPFRWAKGSGWIMAASPFVLLHEQRWLRGWLDAIARQDRQDVARVVGEVNAILFKAKNAYLQVDRSVWRWAFGVSVGMQLLFGEMTPKQLHKAQRLAEEKVREICALGVGLILVAGLRRRVRQCPLPGCDRFRVTYAGRVWHYCSQAHQTEGRAIDARARAKAYKAGVRLGRRRRRKR